MSGTNLLKKNFLVRKFIIGRKGTQPFAIPESKERVSEQHAIVTIDDNGIWMLEDLDSSGNTYVYNSQGILVKVKKKRIDEFTKIVLADTTSMGYSFIAHHLIESDPENYRTEFLHTINKYKGIKQKYNELEEKMKTRRVFLNLVPPVVSAVLALGTRVVFSNNPNIIYMIIGMMSVVTGLLSTLINLYVNKDTSLRDYATRMQKVITCPKCGRPLSEYDINNQICPVCKAHA